MATRGQPRAQERYTWEEFIALPEDDRRELIDGRLLEVDVPNEIHEWVVAQIIAALVGWAREHGGRVHASGYRVRITKHRGVMPDVQYTRKGRGHILGEPGIEVGHPDLAVEVVSPTSGRYDRVVKVEYYASIGVPEYWVVDPQEHTLLRYILRKGTYALTEAISEDAVFRPRSFPGMEIKLAELWAAPV